MRMYVTALLALLTAGVLTACSVDDDKRPEADLSNFSSDKSGLQSAVYDGVWTIDKQEVDTARLEVTDVFRVRLPEQRLAAYCLEEEFESGVLSPAQLACSGQPVIMPFVNQGQTESAMYNSITPIGTSNNGYYTLSFVLTIGGTDHSVALLSDGPMNAVYRYDTGLWTIGITISAFRIRNEDTSEEQVHRLRTPITLYYSAKERVR